MSSITDISEFESIFQCWRKNTDGQHLLLKIKVNPASEVIRLCEQDGLTAEKAMIQKIESLVQQYFTDGLILQISSSAFLVLLDGGYKTYQQRLHSFIDSNSPLHFEINNTVYFPKMIIGITTLCGHLGTTFSRLELALQKATIASGRTFWYIAEDDEEFTSYRNKRIGLRKVRRALDYSELGLFAQPIVALGDHSPSCKYEVLLRHYRTAAEILSPYDVLRFAEFNNIPQEIDLYVIGLLCKHFHQLKTGDGKAIETISVNLTGSSFTSPNFARLLSEIVTSNKVPKEKLVLEVTEDIANNNLSDAIKTMKTFKEEGFILALDDIGIGSSNFRNLELFPVDYFKIDRSYCENILNNPTTKRFVQLIIDIGKSHQKKIIAEGIPNLETLNVLTEMGVDFSQSFLTGKPKEFIVAPAYQ